MYRTVRRDSRDLQPDIDIEIKKKNSWILWIYQSGMNFHVWLLRMVLE